MSRIASGGESKTNTPFGSLPKGISITRSNSDDDEGASQSLGGEEEDGAVAGDSQVGAFDGEVFENLRKVSQEEWYSAQPIKYQKIKLHAFATSAQVKTEEIEEVKHVKVKRGN